MSALFAFLHHVLAFLLVSTLVVEMALLKGPLTQATARQLARTDLLYGIAAGLVVVVGFLRVYHFEKGADYYFDNTFFLLKLALFLVVGGLSLVPTLEFLTWGKSLKANTLPRVSPERIGRLRAVIMLELAGVIGMIACAALMARGHGMPG